MSETMFAVVQGVTRGSGFPSGSALDGHQRRVTLAFAGPRRSERRSTDRPTDRIKRDRLSRINLAPLFYFRILPPPRRRETEIVFCFRSPSIAHLKLNTKQETLEESWNVSFCFISVSFKLCGHYTFDIGLPARRPICRLGLYLSNFFSVG